MIYDACLNERPVDFAYCRVAFEQVIGPRRLTKPCLYNLNPNFLDRLLEISASSMHLRKQLSPEPHLKAWQVTLLPAASILYFGFLVTLSQQLVGTHPVELGKLDQVLSGHRNFLHPLFMLENLALVTDLAGIRDQSSIAIIGRCISAAYASATIYVFALVGSKLYGLRGLVLFFIVFALNGALLISGRYIKEDIYMIFGISLLVLSLSYDTRQHKELFYSSIVGGVGCAIAASSKYVGTVFALSFLVVYVVQLRALRPRDAVFLLFRLLSVFVVGVAITNYRAILRPNQFLTGLGSEVEHAVTSHFGVSVGFFYNGYLNVIDSFLSPFAFLALLVAIVVVMTQCFKSPVRNILWFCILATIACGFLIQVASIKAPRYIFPIIVLLPLAAAISIIEVLKLNTRAFIKAGVSFVLVAIILQEARSSTEILYGITRETRDLAYTYLMTNPIFKNKVVLGDWYVGLAPRLLAHGNSNNIVFREMVYAADECPAGKCDTVDFIVISSLTYSRFFKIDSHLDEQSARRKSVYARWLAEAKRGAIWRAWNCDEDLGFDRFGDRFGMLESPCIYIIRN